MLSNRTWDFKRLMILTLWPKCQRLASFWIFQIGRSERKRLLKLQSWKSLTISSTFSAQDFPRDSKLEPLQKHLHWMPELFLIKNLRATYSKTISVWAKVAIHKSRSERNDHVPKHTVYRSFSKSLWLFYRVHVCIIQYLLIWRYYHPST